MKKIILILLITLSSCSVAFLPPRTVDVDVLTPISGLRYDISNDISIMFLASEGVVLVVNRNRQNITTRNTAYYLLLNGLQDGDDNIVTFELGGQGQLVGNFMSILIVPGVEPGLGIAIQSTRELAINAAKSIIDINGTGEIRKGIEVISPILYFLEQITPIAGPDRVSSISENREGAVGTANIAEVTNFITTPINRTDTRTLTLQSNVTEIQSIFSFTEGPNSVYWSATLDFPNYRLGIIETTIITTASGGIFTTANPSDIGNLSRIISIMNTNTNYNLFFRQN